MALFFYLNIISGKTAAVFYGKSLCTGQNLRTNENQLSPYTHRKTNHSHQSDYQNSILFRSFVFQKKTVMSNFIKNLKSLFVVEEEDHSKKPSSSKPTPQVKPKESKKTTNFIPTVSMNGKADEKFMNILLQALEKANQPGYDYLEFMNAIKSLGKMDMDEATRFKSAYTLAQTMGVTPSQLEKSALHYIDVLQKEDAKFKNALANQQENNIGKRAQAIKDNEKAIVEKNKHITNLQKEIQKHQQQIQKLQAEVEAAKEKVATTNANFVASYQFIVNKIKEDIAKMKEYLK